MRTAALLALLVLTWTTPSSAAPPRTDAEREAAMSRIVWRDGQSLSLPISEGTLKAPAPVRQLLGQDAVTVYEATNGLAAPAGIEAMLFDPTSQSIVYFQKLGSGYVALDDWDQVDADAMLAEIKENTEASNARRREAGVAPLTVKGWLERPHLDKASNSVRWSIDVVDASGASNVNSIALLLGRDGYERLTWVGAKDALAGGLLTTAGASFDFGQGRRYVDHVAGDRVAEYGIAGLVAATLGVKTASKLGLLAILAVSAKKGGALLLVPLLAGLALVKRLVARRKPPATDA